MNGQESDDFVVVGGRESRPRGEGNHKSAQSKAERNALDWDLFGNNLKGEQESVSSTKTGFTQLLEIAKKAKEEPKRKFTGLYRLLNQEFLVSCWQEMNPRSASGVDGMSPKQFGENLESEVSEIVGDLKAKRYRAPKIRQKMIPKGDGKFRPLGIPTVGDKLVQKGASKILEAIYEQEFLSCSYGYRKGIQIHDAVQELDNAIAKEGYQWVLEADIRGFFEHLDHEWVRKMLRERIADESLIQLISKWMKVGIVAEAGNEIHPEAGTPQGGIISPILANIYLHYVIDLWFEKRMKKRLQGRARLFRYADDFVVLFDHERDAQDFRVALEERLHGFGLDLAEDKTRIVELHRWKQKGEFDFLGFTFRWGKSFKGKTVFKRETSTNRLQKAIQRFKDWCQENRSQGNEVIAKRVRSKFLGHRNYYGLAGNARQVSGYFHACKKILFRWLNRRSQKRSMNWDEFYKWWKRNKLDQIKASKPQHCETLGELFERLSSEASRA
jgi:RNA-directed DNA polymerase